MNTTTNHASSGLEGRQRHSRMYERLMFNSLCQAIVGLILAVGVPLLLINGLRPWVSEMRMHSVIAASGGFLLALQAIRHMSRYPGAKAFAYVLPAITISYLLAMSVLIALDLRFSRLVLGSSWLAAMLICSIGFWAEQRTRIRKLAVVPFGDYRSLFTTRGARWNLMRAPDLGEERYNGVVADLEADMPAEWQRFLANCVLHRIPVYDASEVRESLTGRVELDQVRENSFGQLAPNSEYELFKRLFDMLAVLAVAPFVLPICLVTAVLIRLDSPGGVFFVQERVGQGGRPYRMFKFRSMCHDSEKSGAQFAQANDMRVTRIGRVIRKTRIDELPQFINVLKGEMSLIGPRPEQVKFVNEFAEQIPFYNYRHVVRPGITGWAQVTQGYASDADETREKLEHDFYYIKRFSVWLDLLIVGRTIKTMLTGFGAR